MDCWWREMQAKGNLWGKSNELYSTESSHAPCDTLYPGESKQLIPSLIHFRLRAGVSSTRGLQMDNASKGGGDQGGITLR